jgi:hypothetical protein
MTEPYFQNENEENDDFVYHSQPSYWSFDITFLHHRLKLRHTFSEVLLFAAVPYFFFSSDTIVLLGTNYFGHQSQLTDIKL